MVIGSTLRRGAPRCWTMKLYSLTRVNSSVQDPHHGVIVILKLAAKVSHSSGHFIDAVVESRIQGRDAAFER